MTQLTAYILAKNESANIGRCVDALSACQIRTVVLDSGSTDDTVTIAKTKGAVVENYLYHDHLSALAYVCMRTASSALAMVLDADMVVTPELVAEAVSLIASNKAEVILAPIRMYWCGSAMRYGSLCPPKPFLFRGGREYFIAAGHCEVLQAGVRQATTTCELIHNDQKHFRDYLQSQCRYSAALQARASAGELKFRDRLRLKTPFLMALVPAVSLFFKGGIFDGLTGLGYALDRLIAEAIFYRESIADRLLSANAKSSQLK